MSPVPDKDMMQDYDNGKNIRNCETGKQGNRDSMDPGRQHSMEHTGEADVLLVSLPADTGASFLIADNKEP